MDWRSCDRAWPPPHPSVRGQGPGVRRPLAGHPLQPPVTLANFQRGLHAAHAHKNVQEILAVQDHARDGEENLFPHISGKKSSPRLAKWTSLESQQYTSSTFYLLAARNQLKTLKSCALWSKHGGLNQAIFFPLFQVKFGTHKRYQDWFQRQYLATTESQSLRCDLIRFIIGVIHPTNELLCSDIIPRWAVIGWLLTTCTSQHFCRFVDFLCLPRVVNWHSLWQTEEKSTVPLCFQTSK